MKLDGLHILLTYQCIYECDHCFVWGSPRQTGTLTLEQIEKMPILGTLILWGLFVAALAGIFHLTR